MKLLSFAKRLRALAKKTLDDAIVNTVKETTNQPSKLIQFVINLGQTSHKVITRTERCLNGLANDTPIQELDRMRAFHAGSNLLANMYLSTVAGVTVILEVQSDVSTLRKEKLRMELQEIVMELAELHTQKQLELHGGKKLQLHSPKKVEAAPNQDELNQNA